MMMSIVIRHPIVRGHANNYNDNIPVLYMRHVAECLHEAPVDRVEQVAFLLQL